jgi:hypothetical protein
MFARGSRLVLSIAFVAVILLIQSESAFLVPDANAQGEGVAPRAFEAETSALPSVSSAMETNSYPNSSFLPVVFNQYPMQTITYSYNLFLPGIFNQFPMETIFGADMSLLDGNSGFEQMAQAGIYWARTDSFVSWANVESVEGTRNWSVLATLAQGWQAASNRGIEPVVVVRVTPSWAQQRPGYSCGPIRSDKLSNFASFMNELVARYSVPPYNVKYWEIWNEPDIDYRLTSPNSDWGCWGNQDDAYYGGGYYATMLQAVYPQIKAADAQAQVLVGGLLLDCDPRPGAGCAFVGSSDKAPMFLEGILRNGGGSYFDGISYHAYDYYQGVSGRYGNDNWQSAWNTTGPVITAKTAFVNSLLNTYGVSGKFLMNTESAILCDSCSSDTTYEMTKAYYVAQAYAVAIAEGLRANLWYSVLGWRNSGLLNPDLSPRSAYTAYQVARSELRDSTLAGVLSPSDIGGSNLVKGYKFNRGDRRIWVVWSLDGSSHSITPNLGTPLSVVDALGHAVTPASTVTVDLNPLYLEWGQ